MRRGLLALLFLLTLVPAGAKTRIMLISDPHVMGPGLLISEGEAWEYANYYDRKLNDYSRAIFDEIIAIALQENPDLFLISGDLTKDGELLRHQYVAQKLYELKAAGIQALVIPGNHDLGTANACYYDGSLIRNAETVNSSQFAEIYKDFGYGADMERDPSTLTWCCEPVDGLVLIGIDTGQDGSLLNGVISLTTFDWVCERAKTASKAGKQVIVMMHHALIPHVKNAEKFSSTYAVKLGLQNEKGTYTYYSYSTLRNHLADAGVGVVLSGHVHASDIAKDANKDLTRTIHDISTATCAAYPNPYRLLTINDDETLSIRTQYVTELPGVDDFQALAKERMITGLKNLVSLYTLKEEATAILPELFLLYVCGNEPENPRSQELLYTYLVHEAELMEDEKVINYLDNYGVTPDELTEMVHGILEDKSNYGDPDRESLDDDLNTTIPLKGDGWTGMKGVWRLEPGNRSQETGAGNRWYTLQGVRISEPNKKGVYIHQGRLVVNQ